VIKLSLICNVCIVAYMRGCRHFMQWFPCCPSRLFLPIPLIQVCSSGLNTILDLYSRRDLQNNALMLDYQCLQLCIHSNFSAFRWIHMDRTQRATARWNQSLTIQCPGVESLVELMWHGIAWRICCMIHGMDLYKYSCDPKLCIFEKVLDPTL
jgi:hypothetical protein